MARTFFHSKSYIKVIVLFFTLLIVFPVSAGTLNGTVLGKNRQPKRFIRIEIGGPETKTIFTDKTGTFSIQLRGGNYVIKIIEKNKSMEFSINIPKSKDVIIKTFNLNW